MSSKNSEDRFPDDLQDIADELREQRPGLEPLELDQIKLRAMRAARPSGSKRGFIRSPLTSALTIAFLAVGTGGALAGSGHYFNQPKHHGGSASYHQYKPPPPPPPKCKPGYELGREGCIPIPPPPPKCKYGYELSGKNCIPIPPPPPKCKYGYELSGYHCIPVPPPPPKCKSGYALSGYKCFPIPPPPPKYKLPVSHCIKTVIIHRKIVIYGQKGCGTLTYH
jgi:hypothetical protein